jgi:putative oxidoreductase
MLAVFRIVIGLLFLQHGTSKQLGWPAAPAVELGSWPAWYAGVIEMVTGILVAVGLFTMPAAILASGSMAVAYFWRHFPDGFWPINNGGESAVVFCFAMLLLACTGPGRWSLEYRRAGRRSRALTQT